MAGWRSLCACALLTVVLAAVQPGASAERETSTDTALDADSAPAVEYLMSEYGMEEAAAVQQVEFSGAMEDRVPDIHKALGDSFAGAWVDNSLPEVLFVASTQPGEAASALSGLGVSATIRGVEYSQSELDNGSALFIKLLTKGHPDAPDGDSGFRVTVDIQANELDLEVAPYYPMTSELKEAIASFAPDVEIQPTWEPVEDGPVQAESDG